MTSQLPNVNLTSSKLLDLGCRQIGEQSYSSYSSIISERVNKYLGQTDDSSCSSESERSKLVSRDMSSKTHQHTKHSKKSTNDKIIKREKNKLKGDDRRPCDVGMNNIGSIIDSFTRTDSRDNTNHFLQGTCKSPPKYYQVNQKSTSNGKEKFEKNSQKIYQSKSENKTSPTQKCLRPSFTQMRQGKVNNSGSGNSEITCTVNSDVANNGISKMPSLNIDVMVNHSPILDSQITNNQMIKINKTTIISKDKCHVPLSIQTKTLCLTSKQTSTTGLNLPKITEDQAFKELNQSHIKGHQESTGGLKQPKIKADQASTGLNHLNIKVDQDYMELNQQGQTQDQANIGLNPLYTRSDPATMGLNFSNTKGDENLHNGNLNELKKSSQCTDLMNECGKVGKLGARINLVEQLLKTGRSLEIEGFNENKSIDETLELDNNQDVEDEFNKSGGAKEEVCKLKVNGSVKGNKDTFSVTKSSNGIELMDEPEGFMSFKNHQLDKADKKQTLTTEPQRHGDHEPHPEVAPPAGKKLCEASVCRHGRERTKAQFDVTQKRRKPVNKVPLQPKEADRLCKRLDISSDSFNSLFLENAMYLEDSSSRSVLFI